MSSRKYFYYRRHIKDPLKNDMPDWRPQRRHASLETDMPIRRPIGDVDMLHQRPTCLIGDTLKFNLHNWRPIRDNMPHRRPIGDLNMLHPRQKYLIADPLETLECFIWDGHAWSETQWRPRHASLETHLKPTCPIKDQQTCLIGDTLETDMPN